MIEWVTDPHFCLDDPNLLFLALLGNLPHLGLDRILLDFVRLQFTVHGLDNALQAARRKLVYAQDQEGKVHVRERVLGSGGRTLRGKPRCHTGTRRRTRGKV